MPLCDFSDPRWSYLLGVIHGDGCIQPRSVTVAVAYKEPGYLEALCELFVDLGYSPKVYRARTAYNLAVHSLALASELRPTKIQGAWKIPETVRAADYLAGVIDTDGHLTKAPHRKIVITLKQSGNLDRLAARLAQDGLRITAVGRRMSKYRGEPYAIEELRWSGGDQIEWIAHNCALRHPRKAERLRTMIMEIEAIRAVVPLWQQIAEWLAEEPRDIDQIMSRFGLTKPQVDSALGNIKANWGLEVIPPPRVLTKYRAARPQ